MYYFNEKDQLIVYSNEFHDLPLIREDQMHEFIFMRDHEGKVATLVDGDFVYSDKPVPPPLEIPYSPEITPEISARILREAHIKNAANILDRHRNQIEFGIEPTATQQELQDAAEYLEYLRKLPEDPDWFNKQIMTLGDYSATIHL